MSFKDDNDKPPTSKEEAYARRVRPPPERYDPDTISHWSITMMVAWIIWGEIDAVRNEWDDYRNDCADWKFEGDPRARALRERVALDNFERALEERRSGQTAPSDPDLQKKIQEKLEEFKEGSWHRFSWKPSGWRGLRDRAISKNLRPQDAIDELWQAAGEGRIKATALQCKNDKTFDGDPIEIPAHYWPRLKPVDDPLTGKAMLTDDQGRVYREVKFRQSDVKELWPREGEEVHGAGAWITAEARRMKGANEILPDIRISDFARELEGRMKKAAKKAAATNKPLRAVGWRYIKNKLPEWGLWPVSSIQ